MTAKLIALAILFSYLYLWLGRMARSELIEKGWFPRNGSIFLEMIMSPIFVVWGLFFYMQLILSFIPFIIGGGICYWLIIYVMDIFRWWH
ncbi:hypothetical protein THS5294_02832 [Thalassobacter stenotrophicus]|uniref:Uncharacterized protein n=2 Tax=Thalassobacter stenotrophicus TaxID=266809 RepID=A0A0P1F1P5_9RHOB|nr:hypothetical protein THS5294_02832 [Thalassobacter stenotrophicus]SHJ08008.1 hypothetical protein SAMN02744035_02528 [Thalassobacter stenotrophicus DSM 16310]